MFATFGPNMDIPTDFEWGAPAPTSSAAIPGSPEPSAAVAESELLARPTGSGAASAGLQESETVPAQTGAQDGTPVRSVTPLPIPRVRMDLGDIMAERFPGFDPVEFMVEIALDKEWPKSLRLQATKDAARYLRPVVTPEHGTGDRGTIIIVDQTREAAERGDLAALRALGHDPETVAPTSPSSPGDLRPVTIDQAAVVIDPELTS